MAAASAYFASFPATATAFSKLALTKLTMPVLSIGGAKSLGTQLGRQVELVATNAKVIVLPNAGHWIMEEQPAATMDALTHFLAEN